MKQFLIIILSISILLFCCSCTEKIMGGDYDHLEFLTGKIIEINDDNTILIQITKERNKYVIDDKVYVHYDQAIVQDKNFEFDSSNGVLDSNYKPIIGDEIFVQSFPEREYKNIKGYDYRESYGPIIKYIDVNESSENND